MDLRAIADLIREMAQAQGDDLSDRDIAEIIDIHGLPCAEKTAEKRRLDRDFRPANLTLDERPERDRQDRVRWSGVPQAYRYTDRPNGTETREVINVPPEDIGAIGFMRADSPGTWAARIRECIRRKIAIDREKAVAKSRKSHGGRRKHAYRSKSGTYHA